jgi:hypothetical protein
MGTLYFLFGLSVGGFIVAIAIWHRFLETAKIETVRIILGASLAGVVVTEVWLSYFT